MLIKWITHTHITASYTMQVNKKPYQNSCVSRQIPPRPQWWYTVHIEASTLNKPPLYIRIQCNKVVVEQKPRFKSSLSRAEIPRVNKVTIDDECASKSAIALHIGKMQNNTSKLDCYKQHNTTGQVKGYLLEQLKENTPRTGRRRVVIHAW